MLAWRGAFLEAWRVRRRLLRLLRRRRPRVAPDVLGHRTYSRRRPSTYHRLHGTADSWRTAARLRLYERNAWPFSSRTTGTKRCGAFPAAVTLTLARALAGQLQRPRARVRGLLGLPAPRTSVAPGHRSSAHSSRSRILSRMAAGAHEAKRQWDSSRDDASRTPRFFFRLFPYPVRLHDLSAEGIAGKPSH